MSLRTATQDEHAGVCVCDVILSGRGTVDVHVRTHLKCACRQDNFLVSSLVVTSY